MPRPAWLRKGGKKPRPVPSVLEQPLLNLSKQDTWTVRDACEGTQIFGATGSGKTSGSGQAIATSLLRAGFGGLVLTVKPDERETWERYAAATGRTGSLAIFRPGEPWAFNFLNYELNRPGAGAGFASNMVSLFTEVLEVAARRGEVGSQDGFWVTALEQLLRNAIDLVIMAQGTLTLADLHAVISSAPHDHDVLFSEEWRAGSRCFDLIRQGRATLEPDQQADFDLTASYWLNEFPGLAEKTRSIIVNMFTGMADAFLRRPMRALFCERTTIIPEITHGGGIILVDMPVKQYHQVGRFAQVLWKLMWQRAAEARAVNNDTAPVFLWVDESQEFITSSDASFQATARSARVATVYLTQNISNYLKAIGGREAQSATDSLLGNLQTKIFHANGDAKTNEWAERLFAKRWGRRTGTSQSNNPDQPDGRDRPRMSASSNESLDPEVLAHDFIGLAKGGEGNRFLVESIVFQGGRTWRATGRNHLRVFFSQTGA